MLAEMTAIAASRPIATRRQRQPSRAARPLRVTAVTVGEMPEPLAGASAADDGHAATPGSIRALPRVRHSVALQQQVEFCVREALTASCRQVTLTH